jgi:hypothetical protein
MNKLFAVIVGTMLIQSAAFAADKDCDKSSDKSSCSDKAAKKAAKKISSKKSDNNKQIAAAGETAIGAY